MLLKSNKLFILCLLAVSCLSVEARRRSRIDLPASKNASEPTTEENFSTVSEKIEAEKLEAPTPTTIQTDVAEELSESNSSEESPAYEDCDVDNISFEMITG